MDHADVNYVVTPQERVDFNGKTGEQSWKQD